MKKVGPEGRLSNCFIEGMSEAEINQMISDAFTNSQRCAEWQGIVAYKNKKITIRGYFRNGKIESSFVKEIN